MWMFKAKQNMDTDVNKKINKINTVFVFVLYRQQLFNKNAKLKYFAFHLTVERKFQ